MDVAFHHHIFPSRVWARGSMVSVIIPIYSEEKPLPATLEALFRQRGAYEVIVVDGGSGGRTRDIAEADPRLRFETAPKGRAVQMNAAARLARGEWLLFLHTETVFYQHPLKPTRFDHLIRSRCDSFEFRVLCFGFGYGIGAAIL